MAFYFRKRSTLRLPLTLSVTLMILNVTLMVFWIVLLAQGAKWTALAAGVVAFTLILGGLSFWLVLTIKEIRLNNRQANFVDSVTHELKSPIASLKLYLETIRLRSLDERKRQEFHAVMEQELNRLDQLINQLLEVGRLDAIGDQQEPELIELEPLLRRCAETACTHHRQKLSDVFDFQLPQLTLTARQIVLELVFTNLLDNAVKYGGEPPRVLIEGDPIGQNRVRVRITNDGAGVPYEDRRKIFGIFYRGGSELQRRRKGTGLGLYIVSTLVRKLRGKVHVEDRNDGKPGCTFEVDLPGRVDRPAPAAATPQD
ncbi:Sensor histidine kinase GlrK [Caulifigura coniformis]|uniref:histidine kinase n=1 Tax=Caulifigura coniformis TaxID=2527983 RepID=A0A517SIT7_9PLAN|nr:HAMP domain-containing sensor histidine kinase [Caulifigura coniformis]QDT56041.1 Sensor histidine kinase GlrK [Caulifigura coniformis]